MQQLGQRAAANKAANRGSTVMKFILFLALGIAALAIIAAFAMGGESDADGGRYDYWASSDRSLPFAGPRRSVSDDLGAHRDRLLRRQTRKPADT
jgi:hypothetical protein